MNAVVLDRDARTESGFAESAGADEPHDSLPVPTPRLEQLNLDYNNADQASDAKRFSEFLAEDFIVQTPGVTRNRHELHAAGEWCAAGSSVHRHRLEA